MIEIVVNVNIISKKLLVFVTFLKTVYSKSQLWSRRSRSRIMLTPDTAPPKFQVLVFLI
jgi:hypothetical protein